MNHIFRTIVIAGASLFVVGWPAAVHAGDPLRLRVNDASAVPGEIAALVVRTYASRPIRQGQICFVSRPLLRGAGAPAGPFVELIGATVYSIAGDAVQEATLFPDASGQLTMLSFASASATINAEDGPMLVLYYRVRADSLPGESYTLDIDPANTFLSAADGTTIETDIREGQLTIRAPNAGIELKAAAEEPEGNRVVLSLQIDEVLAISSGQIGLRYPTGLLREGSKVFIDKRYGNARWHSSSPRGLLVVSFDSPDATLGQLPGDIIGVMMRLYDTVDPSQDRRVWLDPAYTFLYDEHGATLPLVYDDDLIPEPDRRPKQNAVTPNSNAAARNR